MTFGQTNMDSHNKRIVHFVFYVVKLSCAVRQAYRHYKTKHQSMFKNSEEKYEAIKRAVSGYKKKKK